MIARDLHEPFEELVVGFALSALEPEDEQEFLRHLAGCARCERALAQHADTLAHLAYAVEPATPPPSLLEGIRRGMAEPPRVAGPAPRNEPERPAEPDRADTAPVPSPAPLAPAPVTPAPVAPIADTDAADADAADAPVPALAMGDDLSRARARRQSRRGAAWLSAAAALALVVGLGGWNVALHRQDDRRSSQAGRLTQAVQSLEKGPARTVPLRTREGNGDVSVIAVVQPDWSMSLLVDGLPANDRAKDTYVLWGVDGITPRALATFDVSGRTLDVLTNVSIPADVRHVPDSFAVTRETGRVAPPSPQHPILAQGPTST